MGKRLLLALSVLSVVAAGCGGSSKSSSASGSGAVSTTSKATAKAASSSGGTPDCTKLITVAEAGALFGKPAGAPEGGLNTTGDSESFCDWSLADKNDFSGFTLLQLQAFDSTKFVDKASYDQTKVQDVTVPGASEAFTITEKATEATVNMAVKGKRIVISFTPADKNGAAHMNDVVKLASSVAARV